MARGSIGCIYNISLPLLTTLEQDKSQWHSSSGLTMPIATTMPQE